jgi:hypothetical protein
MFRPIKEHVASFAENRQKTLEPEWFGQMYKSMGMSYTTVHSP